MTLANLHAHIGLPRLCRYPKVHSIYHTGSLPQHSPRFPLAGSILAEAPTIPIPHADRQDTRGLEEPTPILRDRELPTLAPDSATTATTSGGLSGGFNAAADPYQSSGDGGGGFGIGLSSLNGPGKRLVSNRMSRQSLSSDDDEEDGGGGGGGGGGSQSQHRSGGGGGSTYGGGRAPRSPGGLNRSLTAGSVYSGGAPGSAHARGGRCVSLSRGWSCYRSFALSKCARYCHPAVYDKPAQVMPGC